MTSKWLEMSLSVPDDAVDLVCQLLVGLGSTGMTTADRPLDTFAPPSPDTLKNDPILKAYFEPPEDLENLSHQVRKELAKLAGLYPELSDPSIDYQLIDGQDWANDWKQHFPALKVGDKLVICPSWESWQAIAGEAVLTLDPGQAFGTGTHATTSLCLDAIAAHFVSGDPPHDVLDVGTGSGILAMASAALGASKVLATDIDTAACDVAKNNISNNGLDEQITITDAPLEELSGQFDLVLANILAGENIRLSAELVAHLKPGGRLILSGILVDQEQQVLDGFADYPLTLHATAHRDEWTCIVYKRHE